MPKDKKNKPVYGPPKPPWAGYEHLRSKTSQPNKPLHPSELSALTYQAASNPASLDSATTMDRQPLSPSQREEVQENVARQLVEQRLREIELRGVGAAPWNVPHKQLLEMYQRSKRPSDFLMKYGELLVPNTVNPPREG